MLCNLFEESLSVCRYVESTAPTTKKKEVLLFPFDDTKCFLFVNIKLVHNVIEHIFCDDCGWAYVRACMRANVCLYDACKWVLVN